MKKLNQILFKLIFLIFFFFTETLSADKITGIARVIDGDTIELNNLKIRFGGIDAPESYFKGKSQTCRLLINNDKVYCGKLSKLALQKKISDKFIICHPESKDKYKRIIAECFLETESLSSYMVKNGFAFDYEKYSKGKFRKYQRYARENKLGLWSMKFEFAWMWRIINK